jgi:predicted branched-subunit amino acid permease
VIGRGFWRRSAAVQLTNDESTAVATAQTEPRAQRIGFWVTGLVVYLGWNLMTLAGALLGNLIGDVRAYGLDAAAAAAFLGLLWPRLKARQTQAVAVAAGFVATLLTPFLMPGLPVLAAAVVAIVVGVLNLFGRRDEPPHPEAIPMEREVEP